MKSNTGLLPD